MHQVVFVGIERCVCACCIGRGFVLPAPCEYTLLSRREYPSGPNQPIRVHLDLCGSGRLSSAFSLRDETNEASDYNKL